MVDLSVHDFPHIWVVFLNPGNGRFQLIPSRMTPFSVFWIIIPIEMHDCTDHQTIKHKVILNVNLYLFRKEE